MLEKLEVYAVPLKKKPSKTSQKAVAQLSWCPHQHQFSINTPAAKTFSSSVCMPVHTGGDTNQGSVVAASFRTSEGFALPGLEKRQVESLAVWTAVG